ncbi:MULTISPECIES: SH3 domain-containing protein [Leptolyngbya]|uniref:SH3 domain-containing protein n=1 Tax=Leptolyngbya TaxID=47251 RepID=UPI0016866340|nr:SH3 domain-containing protein [Leptolyngbya sp. FACHB-1624]MBD1859095.1 hypothetical protein [Leptolyngbya sp. FACHB-1624]
METTGRTEAAQAPLQAVSAQPESKIARITRSLKKLGLILPSSAWLSLAGLVLAASTLITHVPSAQAAQYVKVSSGISALNVRNGPGTGYSLNGRPLYPGETVRVVQQSGGWYQLPDGGWFSAAYTTTGSGGSSGGTGGGGSAITTRVTTTTTVNVRNGPGTGYSLNGRPLYSGETVRVVRYSNGWYQLPDGGWFSAAYTTTGSGGSSGGIGGGGSAITTRVTTTTTVNVRNGPGTGYSLNGRPLYPGETVRIVRYSNGWYQLPDGGWFSAAYTTTGSGGSSGGTGGGGTPVSGGTPINRTVRATTWVNVRNGPGVNYSLNGRPLNAGETVRVVRQSGGWYQLPDGGWFSAAYAQ